MKTNTPSYQRHRFPSEIISHAVWLYHRFCLSFREVEELLAERGIVVTYETIRQWCQKFGPDYARRLKRRQGRLGDTWHIDGFCRKYFTKTKRIYWLPGRCCTIGQ
jgi:putative transposase